MNALQMPVVLPADITQFTKSSSVFLTDDTCTAAHHTYTALSERQFPAALHAVNPLWRCVELSACFTSLTSLTRRMPKISVVGTASL